jgi:hypothetical protein
LLLVCAILPGFPGEVHSAGSDREKRVYEIYSLMFTTPVTGHNPDKNELYLIAAMTASASRNEPCVEPPDERKDAFQEVLADYEHRKNERRELKPLLTIAKPYLLLSAEEVKAAMKALDATPDPRVPDERFRGATDVFTCSEVYFNKRETLALAAIESWCGSNCGLHQWKVFERLDAGRWEERPWAVCRTFASVSRAKRSRRTSGM